MAWVGVTHPENRPNVELMKETLKQVEPKIARIERQSSDEKCCLCGKTGQLSQEHTPSKKAYNPPRGVSVTIDDAVTPGSYVVWKGEKFQGGIRHRSLCRKCNSQTGNGYNPEYLKFVRMCKAFAKPKNGGATVAFSEYIRPLRIVKQALVTLIATCQSGLLDEYPVLRGFLANREETATDLGEVRVGLYLRANRGVTRMTGVCAFADFRSKQARMLAEFSAWPVGWVLTFDSQPMDGTLDVSSWAAYGYDERVSMQLAIPCQWVVFPYPVDFRVPTARR